MTFDEWWETRSADSSMSAHEAAELAWEASTREAIHLANTVKKNADATHKRSNDSHSQGMSYAADAIARRLHGSL